ncbi:hypothetical protein [Bradyrhizobium sp.]|uniref:hypothetical protein n=1 Tax=Bradyrhizobium sp. TaxID=376 RepID=UPI0025C13F86|nr:hypothetical protein [Bradyrhizobium sp.]MCA3254801.1 hypothetical protein [Alphaproteobacteria bacterium]MCA3566277.1 hypothetical protein [Bradyrhizobium sp.]
MSLLNDIEDFLDRHQMAATKLGREALRDASFVANLRAGRRVFSETEAKVRSFMDDYSPSSPDTTASTAAVTTGSPGNGQIITGRAA